MKCQTEGDFCAWWCKKFRRRLDVLLHFAVNLQLLGRVFFPSTNLLFALHCPPLLAESRHKNVGVLARLSANAILNTSHLEKRPFRHHAPPTQPLDRDSRCLIPKSCCHQRTVNAMGLSVPFLICTCITTYCRPLWTRSWSWRAVRSPRTLPCRSTGCWSESARCFLSGSAHSTDTWTWRNYYYNI